MSDDPLFHIHTGLPRQGPGSGQSTRRAIQLLRLLPSTPKILDIGCGTGAQTLILAGEFDGQVTAVDVHPPFLVELARNAAARGLADRVETRCASMDALEDPPQTYDLIWSEGAVFVIGVSRALELWRPLLKPGGALAFTELSWLGSGRPSAALAFWDAAYPMMEGIEGNCEKARSAGFSVTAHFVLPAEDWWTTYYNPLRRRVKKLRLHCEAGSELETALEETEREIALFERYAHAYGYVFYVLAH